MNAIIVMKLWVLAGFVKYMKNIYIFYEPQGHFKTLGIIKMSLILDTHNQSLI